MQEEIAVSVICNAYNHEPYIKDALDSFIMQKTNFPFEVLIHDDASTDKTADIIREYEKKYPDIIKPIYQKENQYSQKIKISMEFQYPRVKGKYIAMCEGDDYWTDPYKLQKQFDAMESHPELDVCSHASATIEAKSGKILNYTMPSRKNGIIPVEKVIDGGGGFVATNSLFYRAEINKNIPEFRKYLGLDYTLQIHSSLRGGMLYLCDCMSVYRCNANNSWTVQMNKNTAKRIVHDEKVLKMFEILDEETKHKYSEIIDEKVLNNKLEKVYRKVQIKYPLSESDYDVIKTASLKMKIKILLYLKCPDFADKVRQIKRNRRK